MLCGTQSKIHFNFCDFFRWHIMILGASAMPLRYVRLPQKPVKAATTKRLLPHPNAEKIIEIIRLVRSFSFSSFFDFPFLLWFVAGVTAAVTTAVEHIHTPARVHAVSEMNTVFLLDAGDLIYTCIRIGCCIVTCNRCSVHARGTCI